MSWERTHRRYDLVRTVLDEVRRRGPDLPPALLAEIDDVFGSFPAFLADVRRRWYQTFDARLDALLEHPPPDLDTAVNHLRRALEREQPEMATLLAAHPAPTAVDLHHRRTLRTATGVDERDPAASA